MPGMTRNVQLEQFLYQTSRTTTRTLSKVTIDMQQQSKAPILPMEGGLMKGRLLSDRWLLREGHFVESHGPLPRQITESVLKVDG